MEREREREMERERETTYGRQNEIVLCVIQDDTLKLSLSPVLRLLRLFLGWPDIQLPNLARGKFEGELSVLGISYEVKDRKEQKRENTQCGEERRPGSISRPILK